MGVEVLIYSYMAICVAMILFNIAYLLLFKRSLRRRDRHSSRFYAAIRRELDRLAAGEPIEERHRSRMLRRLRRLGGLMAFDDALEALMEENPEGARRYLQDSMGLFTYLMAIYAKKERMQTAYFAYLLSKYQLCRGRPFDSIKESLKALLFDSNLYCRENALRALYSFGDPAAVAEAIRLMDQNHLFHHEKLITDGLLSFEGDHSRLAALLWGDLPRFSEEMQVAVLNYIRFQTGGYCPQMLEILTDERRGDEVRYCAIRYFGRYPYEPARPALLELLADRRAERWSYCAISAVSLARYPGPETVSALKDALHHSNWYVRYNASQSLMELGVSYSDLADVLNGSDRYAREMMQYRLEEQRRQPREEALTT